MKKLFLLMSLLIMIFGALMNITSARAMGVPDVYEKFVDIPPVSQTLEPVDNNIMVCPERQPKTTSNNPVVFPELNSNSKNPKLGDERCFVRATKRTGKIGGDPDKICDLSLPQSEVEITESGHYYVYIYVINDTPGGIAEDVRVRADASFGKEHSQRKQAISVTISSENTLHSEIKSEVTFKSDRNIYINHTGAIDFISGTDLKTSNESYSDLFASETMLSHDRYPEAAAEEAGVLVGDDGRVKSGMKNMQIIRFGVEVCVARDFWWKTELSQTELANEAEVELLYKNVDDVKHEDVYFHTGFSDDLYTNYFVEIVPDSIILTDKTHLNGKPLKNELGDKFTTELKATLGDYEPNEQAIVTYRIRSNSERLDAEDVVLGRFYNTCYVDADEEIYISHLCAGNGFLYETEGYDCLTISDTFLDSGNAFAIKDGRLQYATGPVATKAPANNNAAKDNDKYHNSLLHKINFLAAVAFVILVVVLIWAIPKLICQFKGRRDKK